MRWLTAEPQGTSGLVWLTGGWRQGPEDSGAVAHPLLGEARSWGYCQPTGGQSQVLESGCRAQESQS